MIPPPPIQPLSNDRALYDWLYAVYAEVNGIEPGTEVVGDSIDPASGVLALGMAGRAISDAQSYALMQATAIDQSSRLAQSALLLASPRVQAQSGFGIRVLSASASIAPGTFADVDATAGAVTITIPPAATNSGKVIGVAKSDSSANAVTISGQVNGAATTDLTAQYTSLLLVSNGTEWRAW